MGAENLNPLDELKSLDQQVERVTDLEGLKPIFARIDEIAKQHSDDFEVQLVAGDLKQHLVNRGNRLKAERAVAPPVPPPIGQPPMAPPPPTVKLTPPGQPPPVSPTAPTVKLTPGAMPPTPTVAPPQPPVAAPTVKLTPGSAPPPLPPQTQPPAAPPPQALGNVPPPLPKVPESKPPELKPEDVKPPKLMASGQFAAPPIPVKETPKAPAAPPPIAPVTKTSPTQTMNPAANTAANAATEPHTTGQQPPAGPPAQPPTQPPRKPPSGSTNWRRPLILGAILGAIVAIAGIAVIVNQARKRNGGKEAAANAMQVEFVTTPPNASIRVNGDSRCTSPCKLPLAPGTYQIMAFLDGYDPATSSLEVVAGQPATVNLALAAQPQTVRILTDLDGGKIAVDDQPPVDL